MASQQIDDPGVAEKGKTASAHSSAARVEDDPNDPHYGLEFPTEEELATLRRVPDTIPWKAFFIAIIELCERFSYYGSTVVYTNFIQQPLPPGSRTGASGLHGQAGALGRGQQASTGLTTFNQFWVYVTPLFGGYIADTYLGRYKTIGHAIWIILIGHIILVVSAVPGVIEKPSAIGAFTVALIIIGIGTGGFKSNISPLVAEQYKITKMFIRTEKSGERVIVDPTLTVSRIYMYFYFCINVGALVGQIGMTYAEKFVGFWLAYLLPTCVFLVAPVILFLGRKQYNRTPPTGSVLSLSLRAFRHAARGRWSWNPIKLWRQFNVPDFWDPAKPSKQPGGAIPKWMTYDDVWVDEVARGLKACAVFLWFPLWWLTYNQINSNLTSQAATMETHGLPNDVLSNLDPFALLILIPILDILVYPALRRMGINFTALKKINAGFLVGALAMMCAAIVQHYIYKTSPCGYQAAECKEVSPLNVWIQTPSYILIALSEIFASITGLEYAFTKAPKNMRSLVMSVFLFMVAFSSAIGEAFVPLVADPLLVWNYGVVGVLAFGGFIGVWWTTRSLDAQEDELNNIGTGYVDDGKH